MQTTTKEQDAEWYSSLGPKYETTFGHDPGLLRFLDNILARLPPQANILDVGCGTGKPVASTLVNAGHSVTGIDVSDVMIGLSQKAVPGGQFHVADMRTYDPPNDLRFDAVLNILSLFSLKRAEIENTAIRWNRWLPVGGILCIGTVAAEDCHPETKGQGYDEDKCCARDIGFRFMGADIKIDLMTRLGWEKLLGEAGFEIIETMNDLFVPAKESDCDEENHYFILAKKI
ncbi:hypothetical protein Dda_8761 [Drechslerella dactyloides]|uniref:phosphoethanolamine N-methyltransferase n=1 Tax=Drechslerella dactyloides TaxID=74499 RepID=A0AAD6IUD7_DREDA|nr:hypothetical protein Dda_8761 [Drechslerella dactyloides]